MAHKPAIFTATSASCAQVDFGYHICVRSIRGDGPLFDPDDPVKPYFVAGGTLVFALVFAVAAGSALSDQQVLIPRRSAPDITLQGENAVRHGQTMAALSVLFVGLFIGQVVVYIRRHKAEARAARRRPQILEVLVAGGFVLALATALAGASMGTMGIAFGFVAAAVIAALSLLVGLVAAFAPQLGLNSRVLTNAIIESGSDGAM